MDRQSLVVKGRTSMDETPRAGNVQYIVFTWVPEEQLDEWNEWHNTEHIPNVSNAPQIRSARKYRVSDTSFPAEWQPQYATVYQVDSVEDMDAYVTGPGIALRQEYADRYGAVGKIARMILVEEQRF
jgi:hypothetical protein